MALSAEAIRSLTRRESDRPVILLLTIAHADIAGGVMRLCDNSPGDNIVSNGNTFTAAPFTLDWPSDDEGAPVARLQAINVDRVIGLALEALVTPAVCTLQAVLSTSPDTIERQGLKFELRNTRWDGGFMSAELTQASFLQEPWPRWRVTPRDFPSLFR